MLSSSFIYYDKMALIWAAEKGHWEACMKLAELVAHLNFADLNVSETCSTYVSAGCFIIVLLTLVFKLGSKDGLDVGR